MTKTKKKPEIKRVSRAIKAAPAPRGVKHHAKRIIRLTPMFVHGMVAGAFIGIIAVMVFRNVAPANALSLTSPRDCDSNAVINCGALTTSELQTRYKNKGVAQIYAHFGITAGDINIVGSTAAAGRVFKDGTVKIGDTVVATSAITAGRENIAGSTKVTSDGVTFYKRPPKVSFIPDSISAFVIMQDGQFKYAILGACGNPVMATAVPKVAPPKPVETPVVVTPVVETPTPTASTQTPVSTPTATLTATSLPNTGPGAVIVIAIAAVAGGYIFHITHRHVRRRRRIHHHHHDISKYVTH